jgi:hypothetical protein
MAFFLIPEIRDIRDIRDIRGANPLPNFLLPSPVTSEAIIFSSAIF